MRKLLFLLVGLSLILFTACNDDDSEDIMVTLESQLTDAWIATDIELTGSVSVDLYGEEAIFDLETEIAESTTRLVLASDGTYEGTGETNFNMNLLQDGVVVSTIPSKVLGPLDLTSVGTWSVNENDEVLIDNEAVLFENDQLIFVLEDIGMIPEMNGFSFDFETFKLFLSRE